MKINLLIKGIYKIIIKKYINKKYKNILFIKSNDFKKEIKELIWNISSWLICKNKKNTKYCNNCYSCKNIKLNKYKNYISINIKKKKINLLNLFLNNKKEKNNIKVIYIKKFNYLTLKILNQNLNLNKIFYIIKIKKINNKILRIKNQFSIFKFPILKEINIVNWLKKKKKIKYKNKILISAIRNSFNSPKISLKFLKEKRIFKRKILYKKIIKYINKNKTINLFKILSKKNINLFNNILIDSLKWKLGERKILINIDNKKTIKNISNLLSLKILIKLIKNIFYYYKNINLKNINSKFLIIKILLKIDLIMKKNYKKFI